MENNGSPSRQLLVIVALIFGISLDEVPGDNNGRPSRRLLVIVALIFGIFSDRHRSTESRTGWCGYRNHLQSLIALSRWGGQSLSSRSSSIRSGKVHGCLDEGFSSVSARLVIPHITPQRTVLRPDGLHLMP